MIYNPVDEENTFLCLECGEIRDKKDLWDVVRFREVCVFCGPRKGVLVYKCKRCSAEVRAFVNDVDKSFRDNIIHDQVDNAHECWDGNKGVLELLGAEYEENLNGTR